MRLIDADALIQKRNHAKNYLPDMYVIGQGYVMDAPTVDAAPVVRGEWTYEINEYFRTCSVCRISQALLAGENLSRFNYCPFCGAKMEDKS